MTVDERYMARALELAARGGTRVSPNPMVGCVLVKGGRVVGEGWHRRAGGPHAEPQALALAGTRARGATAYVNLEPCAPYRGKRTPACSQALVSAGVKRVVAAMPDPNPRVRGRGFALLRRAGIRVTDGTLRAEAAELNRAFCVFSAQRRPWVTLKAAATLDGRIEDAAGRSRWITSAAARAAARRMRAGHDAVLVGSGTVLADDPRLSAPGARPLKVVLDARGRVGPRARLMRTPGPTLLVSGRPRRGLPAGVECLVLPSGPAGFRPGSVLKALARRGVGRLFVEGGSAVHSSFLDSGLVDEVALFLAPRLTGGGAARGFYEGRGRRLSSSLLLAGLALRRIGGDILVTGRVEA
ncbi:MAG: bifunctional diaminohydroxyphosphoribosylaminopyrimidine deaminase/5-amino-6-(5-phosphoribosylamino)uracil reductase RibD [Elusimicrobia bacterium]|nr:bifunctional diaminohydroxyphosphoribosylaminopyrimidine deaminase/5-amino-6-(5-phosphoribosylamino)uracil reductase RibD [Elusimicrobiota bacterium]